MQETRDKSRAPANKAVFWRWLGVLVVLLVITLLFAFIHSVACEAILREVRQQAMGVAMAVARAIDANDLEAIRTCEDINREAYRRVAKLLGDIERTNPDVRYAYTMRRSVPSHANGLWDYEYIVDAPSRDANGDGIISRSEMSEPPGQRYASHHLPALQKAWSEPSADPTPSPDPPYPDVLSGYAPIRNRRGQTVAIAGVDITAETVGRKKLILRIALIPTWLLFSLLGMLSVYLYNRQTEALADLQQQYADLAGRNRILRAANLWLAETSDRSEIRRLAQDMQKRLVPSQPAQWDHLSFDTFHLGCEMVGGDLFDVFDLDDDHIGIYMADVAGHGIVAAMVAGLLKSAVSAQRNFVGSDGLSALMLDPQQLLCHLNQILQPELPPNAFVTMIYAVFDIPRCAISISSAGHPAPLRVDPTGPKVVPLSVAVGPAIGLLPEANYPVTERPLRIADRLVFYSDGVTDAVNIIGQPLGLEKLIECIEKSSDLSPTGLTRAITKALQEHCGPQPLRDDCSVLVAEIR